MQQPTPQGNISLSRESPPEVHRSTTPFRERYAPILVSALNYIGRHSDLYPSDSLIQMKSHAAHRIPRPILSKLVHL